MLPLEKSTKYGWRFILFESSQMNVCVTHANRDRERKGQKQKNVDKYRQIHVMYTLLLYEFTDTRK